MPPPFAAATPPTSVLFTLVSAGLVVAEAAIIAIGVAGLVAGAYVLAGAL